MSKNNPDHKPRQPIDKPPPEPKKGLSTGAKVGIGLGIAAGVAGLAFGAHKIFKSRPEGKGLSALKSHAKNDKLYGNAASPFQKGLIKGKHGRK